MSYWDEDDDKRGGWADEPYGGSRHDDDWDDDGPDDGGDGARDDDRGGRDDDGRGSPRWLELLVALVAAVAVVVLVVKLTSDDGDDGDDEVATSDEEESTTSTSRRTTTTRASTSTSSTTGVDPGATVPTIDGTTSTTRGRGSGGGGGTGGGTTTTRRPGTPQPTTPVYEDLDPRCANASSGSATQPSADWAERWETQPQLDDPATLSVCIDDVSPRIGQAVTITIRADDPDAEFVADCVIVTIGGAHVNTCGDSLGVGDDPPNPTPSQRPGLVRRTIPHTFGAAGSVTIYASARSGTAGPFVNPYADTAIATLAVQVG